MTLRAIGAVDFPMSAPVVAGALAVGTTTLDAASEKAGFVFRAPKTGNISIINWRTATVTTGATVDVRLETVDATTGYPTGTLVAANTNASVAVASADDNVTFRTTLTAAAAVTKGDVVAAVITADAVTPGAMQIRGTPYPHLKHANIGAYGVEYTAAAWSKNNTYECSMSVDYDDATRPPLGNNAVITALSTSAITAGQQAGNRFTIPMTCEISGMWAWLLTSSTGNRTFKLYASTDLTNPIATATTHDKDVARAVTANTNSLYADFSSPVTVYAGTVLYAVFEPDTAAGNIGYVTYDNAAEMLSATNDFLIEGATRAGTTGAFTIATTTEYFIGLVLSKVDDGFGAGRPSFNLGVN